MMNDFADLTEEMSKLVQEDFQCWPQVGEGPDITLHERPGNSQEEGFVCVLVSSIERVPFQRMVNARRPENMGELCKSNAELIDAEVVKIYAPGDCLVKAQIRSSPKVSMIALMSQPAFDGTCLASGLQSLKYMRVFQRCDFPAPGMVHGLWGNVGKSSDSEESEESAQSGLNRGPIASRISRGRTCMCSVLEPLENGESTRLHLFTFLPAERKWMIPTIAKTWCATSSSPHCAHSLQHLHLECPYVVLRLKKCSRGPPLLLLPKGESPHIPGRVMDFNNEFWIQSAISGSFSFPEYFQRLLVLLGLLDFLEDVYDSMDGRRLVFFQVALRIEIWRAVETAVAAFFAKHSSAYRHFYGGRAAPNIQVGAAPLFLEEQLMPRPALDLDSPAWPIRDVQYSFKNTFIHAGDAPSFPLVDLV